jgi:predicted ATPase
MLPWRTSELLGRDEELRLLAESLATRRLVTVVGPGGVGKTRLMLEAGHRHIERGGRAWWADLTTVEPERLVHALTEATGVELGLADDPAAALCAALRTRRGLLCVDNAEHLLDALAPVVEALLASAPELVVLVTSRERLALDGESVRVLAPLPLPEGADRANPAVRLFVERAPGLAQEDLADDDVGLVAQMCRRLDGLPLAIELGAARAATFGLSELAGRLGRRLDLLTGGRRTAAARHRTLRAVVDWSHELLTPAEARLFHRLAVFPGAFSLDQVEAVCADDAVPRPAVAGLLARLVEQSLVQSAQGRFWLLETLRAYAGELLDASGDHRALRERHAHDTAARLAEADRQLWTAAEPSAVAALTELVVDMRAAWAYAIAHDRPLAVRLAGDSYDFAYIRQRLDLLAWGERVASWEIAHPGLPRALAAAAAAAWAGGRLDEAAEYGERAVAVAETDPPAAARAVTQLGNLAMFLERSEAALERFRTAASLHREAGEEVRALADDVSVAQAMIYAGRSVEAGEILAELLPKAHRAGNPSLLSWAYYITGEAAAAADIDRAIAAYDTAIEYGNHANCRLFVMLAQGSSVAQAARRGAPAVALEQFRRILRQQQEVGNELIELWVLRYLVVLLDRLGAYHDAAVLAGTLIAARGRYPNFGPHQDPVPTAVDHIREGLGTAPTDVALSEGKRLSYPEAIVHARRAIESATATTVPPTSTHSPTIEAPEPALHRHQ